MNELKPIATALPARPIASGVRIGHVHLKVSDLDRALDFYCGVLGFSLMQRYGADAAFIAAQSQVNRIVHDIVHDLGGSISAEHGIGQLKREELQRYKSAVELDMMRAVKRALDPQGIMNPGKVL